MRFVFTEFWFVAPENIHTPTHPPQKKGTFALEPHPPWISI